MLTVENNNIDLFRYAELKSQIKTPPSRLTFQMICIMFPSMLERKHSKNNCLYATEPSKTNSTHIQITKCVT